MPVLENPDNSAIHPGLSIIHANHMEDLRRVAIEWIGTHPLQPLENETFIVQSNGMAQWLKLAMASNDGCGISAAVQMKLPARFLWDAYRAVLGEDRIPDHSPYDKDQLIWRIFRLLPTLTDNDWFSPLKRYLDGDKGLRKRHQLAFRLADLYDQYQVYRADWLKDWAVGKNCLRNAMGKTEKLPSGQYWQAHLWRCIHEEIPEDKRSAGRFQLHQLFLEGTKSAASRPPGLPRRVIVFGISSLPGQTLEAIHALSHLSQVLIFAHNPCRHYWAEILEDRELLRIHHARHTPKASGLKNLQPARTPPAC
jgi:exodeoxyribonuclease V gamma subunit